jgi:hypothetical protein
MRNGCLGCDSEIWPFATWGQTRFRRWEVQGARTVWTFSCARMGWIGCGALRRSAMEENSAGPSSGAPLVSLASMP